MQIGIFLWVTPYAFSPLIFELVVEIVMGTYLKKIQVQIMGENADNEYK